MEKDQLGNRLATCALFAASIMHSCAQYESALQLLNDGMLTNLKLLTNRDVRSYQERVLGTNSSVTVQTYYRMAELCASDSIARLTV